MPAQGRVDEEAAKQDVGQAGVAQIDQPVTHELEAWARVKPNNGTLPVDVRHFCERPQMVQRILAAHLKPTDPPIIARLNTGS
jgi:hypothetical protein